MRLTLILLGVAFVATSTVAAEISLLDKLTIRNACAADMEALCGGIQPGEGRLRQCVAEHAASFSETCRKTLSTYADRLAVSAEQVQ